ncbi:DUF4189 domain-containing protein [Acidovorax sacchari]
MHMKFHTTCPLLLTVFIAVSSLHAQTACPSGVAAGSARCGPSGDSGDSALPRPTGHWVKTWGALVSSNQAGGAWSSKGKNSEADARQDALTRCQAQGASDCKVDATFFNQCIAVSGSSAQRGVFTNTGKNKEVAGSRALKDCQDSGRANCAVVFTECTDPYFVRY